MGTDLGGFFTAATAVSVAQTGQFPLPQFPVSSHPLTVIPVTRAFSFFIYSNTYWCTDNIEKFVHFR